ncbi:MAG TPA: hypothetical protein VFO16_14290 [Pseudonocardiaceae bacterium]|nr:hypothetical protein [Pseudonocardiaceae bacterium]
MGRMVQTLRSRQQGTSGHAANPLTGDTPEGRITQPVAWWFGQPVPAFLAALADPANGWITPGDPRRAGSSPSWPAVTIRWRGYSVRSRPARPKYASVPVYGNGALH